MTDRLGKVTLSPHN